MLRKSYKSLIFDLDRTLWDFETSSANALSKLYSQFNLDQFGIDEHSFINDYKRKNEELWKAFRKKEIAHSEIRRRRFLELLEEFGVNDEKLSKELNQLYIENCPKNGLLFENTYASIKALKDQGYDLYIASNGLQEIQEIKLQSTGLASFFTEVFCSNRIGAAKPQKEFFEYIMNQLPYKRDEVCYLGDEIDVDGRAAIDAQIDFILVENGEIPINQFI